MDRILEVKDLKTWYKTDDGIAKAVDGVSFSLAKNRTLGVIGESGCGKSVTALSVMRLVPMPPGYFAGGDILWKGKSIIKASEDEMRRIRGNEIAMIFQEPMSSLNPVFTCGNQIMEQIMNHREIGKAEARQKAIELLNMVGIPNPSDRVDSYPHELSGGMRQRVMIAMALSCGPELLIADEPTNAMEPTTQAQIFRLLTRLNQNSNTTILLISHDLQMLSQWADKINVLYCGQTVETALSKELVTTPHHPYTQALIRAIPDFGSAMPHKSRLNTMPGAIPLLEQLPIGCRLGPRCPYAQRECIETPRLTGAKNHLYACHFPLNMERE